ncbi:YceI family protein [Rhabdothermincola sediminis]|uniref:YceI family protein n=1 Tax=Rhabdothermincola sediminis TaxID=2751370 RepID=UPI001AA0A5FD|nr:YceI family protein [Rhabdothermincola sediminis]
MQTPTIPSELTGTYRLDPAHSRVGFVARHAMITKVRGSFDRVEGTGYFDASSPTSSHLEVRIDAGSVNTRNDDRDAHLRSPDFLDVDHYPEIRFVSTSVEQVEPDRYRVSGDLTIRDVTRPITIELAYTGTAVDPWGNQRIGFEGHGVLNRKDWGLTWNTVLEAGGVLVSEKVDLEVEVSAIRLPDES